jgi:hypothetical protein
MYKNHTEHCVLEQSVDWECVCVCMCVCSYLVFSLTIGAFRVVCHVRRYLVLLACDIACSKKSHLYVCLYICIHAYICINTMDIYDVFTHAHVNLMQEEDMLKDNNMKGIK